jgi:hypothetical protein
LPAIYGILADLVVVVHLGFIVFVFLGALLVLRWPRLVYPHVTAAVWGALVEFKHWPCPLTPLENWLRTRSGADAYGGGFVDHYIVPIVYPPGLTPQIQVLIGTAVLAVNLGLYGWLVYRQVRRSRRPASSKPGKPTLPQNKTL